jgi:8-oxo-dGTP diphosphatase
MVTEATLVSIVNRKERKLLLKRSTRGISKSKWNSVGGKLAEGETPEQNAMREAFEESGLKVNNLFYHGLLNFHNYGKEEVDFSVHLFSTGDFSGELLPKSDDGGELEWFPLDNLPMKDMWKDDEYWMEHMLKREVFDADFYFDKENKEILKHEIKVKK